MKPPRYGDADAWFGTEDSPAPHHTIIDPAPQLTIAVAATHPSARVTVRYRRPNTSWHTLEVRKSRSSPQANYYTALFPRTEPGMRVEYEVLVRLSATGGDPARRVGEVCWFEVAEKSTRQSKTKAPPPSSLTTPGPARSRAPDESRIGSVGMVTAEDGKAAPTQSGDDAKPAPDHESPRAESMFILSSRKNKRLACLKRCQSSQKVNGKLDILFHEVEGDFTRLTPLLKASGEFDDSTIQKLHFTNELADLADDDEAVVGAFLAHPKTGCLRDIALNLKKTEFHALVDQATKDPGKTGALHDRLFRMAPKDVLHRMVRDKEFDEEEPVRQGLLTFFQANPNLDFRKDSVLKVLNQPEALNAIPPDHREKVVRKLKSLQRLSSVSPKAEAVPTLMKSRLDSAYAINEVPLERFVALYGESLGGEPVAKAIHARAQDINVRNEHALIALREALLSPTIHMVHGGQSADARKALAEGVAKQKGIAINFETLFGSVDVCECKHCNSVYSPAAYLVELFQYLRNNNLVPPPEEPVTPDEPPRPDEPLSKFTGQSGIQDTPLEKLFRRRPDLGDLLLTCENTNTLIPYIDLVNEVMESFVVNLVHYEASAQEPKKAYIPAYNVTDESSGELLAEAHHTNNRAYDILRASVYPVCRLPYHQPIDAIRLYLKFLKTSRYELFNTFRKAIPLIVDEHTSQVERERLARLQTLQILSVDRAIAAEYLGLTEEDYVILAKEAFHTKEWYELNAKAPLTAAQYWSTIGLRNPWEYYGLASESAMLDELKWVKPAQATGMVGFLRRVNILYVDLIELLKTRYINPNSLSGRALAYLNTIPYSYRYLQTLVDGSQPDFKNKYRRVVEVLQEAWIHYRDNRFDEQFIACWVYKYFAKIGKVIVLENASTCACIEGTFELFVINKGDDAGSVVHLSINANCEIHLDKSKPKKLVGHLDTSSGTIVLDQSFLDGFSAISNQNTKFLGKHGEKGFIRNWTLHIGRKPYTCVDSKETCDISKTQLKHLDGTELVTSEYDRFHRFIRLWCKLGWRIDEVDQAITGVGETVKNPPSSPVGFSASNKFTTFRPSFPPNKVKAPVGGAKAVAKLAARIDRPPLKSPGTKVASSLPVPLGAKLTGLPRETDPKALSDTMVANIPPVEPEKDCTPEPISKVLQEINSYLIDQLVAVKQIQERTGLELAKLLTFWTSIGTTGERSLYERLFLQYNLIALDDIFRDDRYGVYLTQGDSISDHLPALMAAFKVNVSMLESVMTYAGIEDALTLANVSHLYRHILLAKVLGCRLTQLPAVLELLSTQAHAFSQPTKTLTFLQLYERIDNSGFETRQLNYIVRNEDDLDRPIAPDTGDIFRLAISLRNALLQIETDHADIHDAEEATEEFLRGKLSLLFDSTVVDPILNLVQGTTVYQDTTRNKYTATLEQNDRDVVTEFFLNERKKEEAQPGGALQTLLQRVQFSGERGLQVTGILTESDRTQLMQVAALVGDPDEQERFLIAVKKILEQPTLFFDDVLASMFSGDDAEARTILLAPDSQAENGSDDSASTKRVFLTQAFLPYLREQLRQRQVVQLLASDLGLDQDLASKLVLDVIQTDKNDSLYQEIVRLREQRDAIEGNPDDSTRWEGLFVPEQEGIYTFVLEAEGEASLMFDRRSAWSGATRTDDELIRFYHSKPLRLKAGVAYPFLLEGHDEDAQGRVIGLFMRLDDQPQIPISNKYLFPALRTEAFKEAYLRLHKAALLINGFGMTMAELLFFLDPDHSASFDGVDFNELSFAHWLRLEAFYRLKKSLPSKELSVIDFLRWTHAPDGVEAGLSLVTQIHRVTGWQESDIEKLISTEFFYLADPTHFRNEENLLKLQGTLKAERKVGVGIDLLFSWGAPLALSDPDTINTNRAIVGAIRDAIRARYTQEEWEEAIKPVHDQLRENQKQALIAYLLAQPVLRDWGVRDADSLFEFFLIDVQMDACMETSRIKQAISSVQLYIQRCFLGLEQKHGVSADILDRQRWEWMSRYRVWEANRKVFLYPENWIRPELRDDKSPFFKELESELLQNDVSQETVKGALAKYIVQVDEVANLEVVGEFIEGEGDSRTLHVIGRTRNAPYRFYYRYYLFAPPGYWYPWEKVEVDIPAVDIKDRHGQLRKNGVFVMPVVWKNRLFLFFPQFMQMNWDSPLKNRVRIRDAGENNNAADIATLTYYEIKMAWSEYKEGKWTPKQVSSDAIYTQRDIDDTSSKDTVKFLHMPEIEKFIFAPFVYGNIVLQLYYLGNVDNVTEKLTNNKSVFKRAFEPLKFTDFGSDHPVLVASTAENKKDPRVLSQSFVFDGNQTTTRNGRVSDTLPLRWLGKHNFHREGSNPSVLYPIQAVSPDKNPGDSQSPRFQDAAGTNKVRFSEYNREYAFQHELTKKLLGILRKGRIDRLFDVTIPLSDDNYGANDGNVNYHELKRPYALYNWEALFHSVALLADHLSKSQRFEEAMAWWHYIFDPINVKNDISMVWKFLPFHFAKRKNVLEEIFSLLQPNASDQGITEWRDNPFQPHVIARGRPSAYMKWVVMKYIDNLIAWGDSLFRQDTIESINQATQLYVLAGHILGPRPEFIPQRGRRPPKSYMDLVDKWDAFSNAMGDLELLFPFSNQIVTPTVGDGKPHYVNVYGFATGLYFCIPDNPKLLEYWDTVADRLFKIRHCLNIEGVFRKLALFEPPIDPALLVQAAAQGLSIGSVLNDLSTPMPNYRFNYLLARALEVVSEVKSLGNALLSALEKKDGESLSLLRAKHDTNIQTLVKEIRMKQLEEAQKTKESLEENRKAPAHRLEFYQKLVGEEVSVPDRANDYSITNEDLPEVIDESGMKLIGEEVEEIKKAKLSRDLQIGVGVLEHLASVLHALPTFKVNGSPIGVGTGLAWGGTNLGNVIHAHATGLQIGVSIASAQSSAAGRKAAHLRQLYDRRLQANMAGLEVKQIDKQITAQQIRIDLAQKEIDNHQVQIDQTKEVEEFLKNKFSNDQLYHWMGEQLKDLYYQTYSFGYDLAKKAEKAYRFDIGLSTSDIVKFGYWNSSKEGLLAGEQLYLALKHLEQAYIETKPHDYEITKSFSLRQLSPLALIALKEEAACEFTLPEELFDLDYPGHYKRRIKTVAVSIPCIVGPHTSLNCTLRLLKHEFRNSKIATTSNYPKNLEEADERFVTNPIPTTAIAVSQGQNDSGVFELSFQSERYLPFEGSGAISTWRLELPQKYKQFDYQTISDVILHLRYTSCEGGETLKEAALAHLDTYVSTAEELSNTDGLFQMFSLFHEFPNECHRLLNAAPNSENHILALGNLKERFPFVVQSSQVESVEVADIRLFTPGSGLQPVILQADHPELVSDDQILELSSGSVIGNLQQYVVTDEAVDLNGFWGIQFLQEEPITKEHLRNAWLVMKYQIAVQG